MHHPQLIDDSGPLPQHLDALGRCWWGCPAVEDPETGELYDASWVLRCDPFDVDTHWLPVNALPVLHSLSDDRPEPCGWMAHPSLTAADRNPSLCR